MAVRAGSPGVPRVVMVGGLVMGQLVIGRWPVLAHRVRKPLAQGQFSGRCRWRQRALAAIRAGSLIRVLRIVAKTRSITA